MRVIITIFIYQLWTLCSAQNKNAPAISLHQIPYDTIYLKKDYRLIFATTDESRLLRLAGPTIDTVIISTNIKAPIRYLGWLQSDFEDYFMIYSSAGGDTAVHVFNKLTGAKILNGRLISIDKIKGVLYFAEWKGNDKLGLFDMNTMKVELFDAPKTPCGFWLECIFSYSLSEKELTVEYAVLNGKREKKVYIR